MKYIDYKNMKEFYSVDEVCRLLEMNKQGLRTYAEKYEVEPVEDQFGNWGFPKKELRKLHHLIYEEQRSGCYERTFHSVRKGPWDD